MSKYLYSIIVCAVLFSVSAMAAPIWNWSLNQTSAQILQMMTDWDAQPVHSNNHATMMAAGECMRVYVVNKANLHSLAEFTAACKAQGNAQYCINDEVTTKAVNAVCRNARIFMVDLFNAYMAAGKRGDALNFPIDDPSLASINFDAYLEEGLKLAPANFLKRIENGKCTLPENAIIEALKAANRFWSAKLIDDTTKTAAEPIVARIRTLLSTY